MQNNHLVSCVILDDYGRVLLLHRSDGNASQWELPGGEVDEDELPEVAAVRQMGETLGVNIRLVKALGSETTETDEGPETYSWYQASIMQADPALHGAYGYDDLAYFDTEDLPSLSLAPSMMLIFDRIMSGEVVLES